MNFVEEFANSDSGQRLQPLETRKSYAPTLCTAMLITTADTYATTTGFTTETTWSLGGITLDVYDVVSVGADALTGGSRSADELLALRTG